MFSEVLLALNQERVIIKENVHNKVLERLIWKVDCCLFKKYCKSKVAAIELMIHLTGDEMPSGIKTALVRDSIFQYNSHSHGEVNVTIKKLKMKEVLGPLLEEQCK